MNGRSSEIVVQVVFSQPLAQILGALGINGCLGKFLCQETRWDILPLERLTRTPEIVTSRSVGLFRNEAMGNIHTVLSGMVRNHFRPASVHEFLALTQSGNDLPPNIVGLGTLWGKKIGQEKVLCWRQGKPYLVFASFVWPEATCFPAVYYVGQTNPLPGMPWCCSL